MRGRFSPSIAWVIVVSSCAAACARSVVHSGPRVSAVPTEPTSDRSAVTPPDAAADGAAGDASPTRDPTSGPRAARALRDAENGDCTANAEEVRHQVTIETVGNDMAVFTVTRDFEARVPTVAVCLQRTIELPDQAVVES